MSSRTAVNMKDHKKDAHTTNIEEIKRYETKRKANKHKGRHTYAPHISKHCINRSSPFTASSTVARKREREKPKKAKGCVHERDKGPNL
jgi:hypothetical protein